MSKKLNNNKYIDKCKKIHSDRYDYSKTNYTTAHDFVIVTCKKHGDFKIKAYSHSSGNNCYKCYEEERNKRIIPSLKFTKEEFINECNKKHNNKYDYSNIKFKNLGSKIELNCEIHGKFEITGLSHLAGRHCRKCYIDNKSKIQTINIFENIKIFENVHNNKYDYSKIDKSRNYKSNEKIEIICSEHGPFFQQVSVHKNGNGCKKCASSKSGNLLKIFEINKELGNSPGIFYKLKFKHKSLHFEFLKVGITRRSIKMRYNTSQYNYYEYEVLEQIIDTNINVAKMEKDFKNDSKNKKFKFPNDLKFIGWTECFQLN